MTIKWSYPAQKQITASINQEKKENKFKSSGCSPPYSRRGSPAREVYARYVYAVAT